MARDVDVAAASAMLGGGSAAWCPGRCTIVGEHLDYVGGRVLSCALDIGVATAVAESPDGRWHVLSSAREVTRDGAAGCSGDIADRPLAAISIGGEASQGPLTVAIAASLPDGAGLSSSAAVVCATLGAVLMRRNRAMAPLEFAELAFRAEHDVVGVPCGRLDHRSVVEGATGHVLDLDCGSGETVLLRWPWQDVVLVVVDSGVRHDTGDPRYAALRRDAVAVLAELGVRSCRGVAAADVPTVSPSLTRRAQHIHAEVLRVDAAAVALSRGDEVALGAQMSAAHADLRDLLGASVPVVEAVVGAAAAVDGCLGARLVGAGFGGSVAALCRAAAAERCAAAMVGAAPGASWRWTGRPSAGMAELSPGLFGAPSADGRPPES